MKKQTISDSGMLKKILIYGCLAALVSTLMAMIGAYLIIQQMIDQETITYLAPAISVASVLVCSLVAAKTAKDKKIIAALGTAFVYFVITLFAKMAFFPGESVYMLRNGLLCMIAGLVSAVIICIPKKKRRLRSTQRK